ncbi:hypothetical protein GCM10023238_00490 [Streptomyces heliomycini]
MEADGTEDGLDVRLAVAALTDVRVTGRMPTAVGWEETADPPGAVRLDVRAHGRRMTAVPKQPSGGAGDRGPGGGAPGTDGRGRRGGNPARRPGLLGSGKNRAQCVGAAALMSARAECGSSVAARSPRLTIPPDSRRVHHREPSHGVPPHQLHGVLGGVLGVECHRGGRVHREPTVVARVASLRDAPQHDVTVGEHTEQITVVRDEDVADVLLAHQARRPRHRRHGLDGRGVRGHHVRIRVVWHLPVRGRLAPVSAA